MHCLVTQQHAPLILGASDPPSNDTPAYDQNLAYNSFITLFVEPCTKLVRVSG